MDWVKIIVRERVDDRIMLITHNDESEQTNYLDEKNPSFLR